MQREAAGIAAEIREYLERREKPGLVEQPYERKRIADKIELFGRVRDEIGEAMKTWVPKIGRT